MPTYEYVCRACGHEFEEFQSIKAEPIAVCPKCRKRRVERRIGIGGAVIFKGGGFYETDYRSESYRSGAEAEKKATESVPADAGAKPGAKDDSKDESKAGAKAGPKADATSDARSHARNDVRAESRSEEGTSRTSESRARPDASRDTEPPATRDVRSGTSSDASSGSSDAAVRAENRRIDARATHPSRIGRGIGNVVGRGGAQTPVPKIPASKTPAKAAAPKTARPSKPATRAKGRGR